MNLRKTNQKGFTLVELIIVIVVIGILATIALVAYSSVQTRARDAERATDIRSLADKLDVYATLAGNGSYPTLAQISTDASALSLIEIQSGPLHAPGTNTATSLVGTAAANKDQYGYQPTKGDGTACAVTTTPITNCTKYTITWFSEQDNTVKSQSNSQ